MPRPTSAVEVLEQHQFPESGGGCTGRDGWGLAVSDKDENRQMAEHQLEMLEEAGFKVVPA